MLARSQTIQKQLSRLCLCMAVVAVTLFANVRLHAQVVIGNAGVVGGIRFSADGVLNNQSIELSNEIRQQIESSLKSADTDLSKSGLRAISLKALGNKMVECKKSGKPFPASLTYMAGLQRIEYVMVTDDDVVIAGPGEGFKTDSNGNVLGEKSGMPVIHLQDFLVAMRYAENARRDYGITVSIDPTEDGIRNVQKLMRRMNAGSFDEDAAKALEEAGGPQKISLTGVPEDSRFSQVLVSADYKMKRLAMGLEKSPEFLPSILEMAQAGNSNPRSITPRFWMECHYEPVSVNDQKTIWKLSGQGVRTRTQQDVQQKDGSVKAGKTNKLAEKWADTMTNKYDELSKTEPVFRELRNLMDLSVVAAIITREKLLQKVSIDTTAINGLDTIETPKFNVPQTVPTQCSFTKLSRSLMVTTSGGVTVDSWTVASNTTADSKLAAFAEKALNGKTDSWWWNAN